MLTLSKAVPPHLIGATRRHPLWSGASDEALRRVLRLAQDVQLRAGETLFRAKDPADSMFLLIEGAARMFYPGPQRTSEITVVLFQAPAAFGDAEGLAGIISRNGRNPPTGPAKFVGSATRFKV